MSQVPSDEGEVQQANKELPEKEDPRVDAGENNVTPIRESTPRTSEAEDPVAATVSTSPASSAANDRPSTASKYPIVKLIDFGFANQWQEGVKLRTSCGSLAYSAPEILLGMTAISLLYKTASDCSPMFHLTTDRRTV